ncbi:MAG TPA: methyltransferase domain-containing protein [Hungateiclostridium thermocellum]|jgi:ubiquinone/menaquinone biosynthesis C-methylase UbiE|uniref:class I SAM-dependent methyltransferase n=1 Tax=Acetivibrio thermocellus TaxID=1515 RepID=UPI00003C8C80|nr:methyltransferase domain-containing protein [Acetivibrio thermocellus]NLU26995.1 class I SAM-dependent methyltransferase [Acetivibrio thermocellus]THJ78721.1 methyltransferase domain-containing protein [Acetivibrio thermocellus]UWV46613.1 class I SAM-dependent methyltransferase [Acetivibrio thermocellus]HBW27387.1 methyltransferase domain-containing protein [Acetivibrio thermocellus]HOP93735.1 methyltransferase domain-containing protein [Acetivibrio thermocellus]
MGDLSLLENNYFDIVYHPISLCFVPDIEKVYSEVYRVLKNNGIYSVSYCNPSTYPLWFEGEKNGWHGIGYRIAELYILGEIKIN